MQAELGVGCWMRYVTLVILDAPPEFNVSWVLGFNAELFCCQGGSVLTWLLRTADWLPSYCAPPDSTIVRGTSFKNNSRRYDLRNLLRNVFVLLAWCLCNILTRFLSFFLKGFCVWGLFVCALFILQIHMWLMYYVVVIMWFSLKVLPYCHVITGSFRCQIFQNLLIASSSFQYRIIPIAVGLHNF